MSRPLVSSPTAHGVLYEARFAAGLSRPQLALLSGVSRREIARIERGEVRRPRRTTLLALTAALSDIDLSMLMGSGSEVVA